MKKNTHNLLALLLWLLSSGSLLAQNVIFNDANFKTALLANASINTVDDGEISLVEAAAFTGTMNVSSLSITDLTGIEAFTAISTLFCGSNSIGTLDLTGNTALRTLNARSAGLTSIDLSANTLLTYLELELNNLSSLDVSNNTQLTDLHLQSNSNLSVLNLSSNTSLRLLRIHHTNIGNIDLNNNTELRTLLVSNTPMTTIDVTNLTMLQSFSAEHGLFSTLDFSNNAALATLNLAFSANLTSLDVSNSPLTTYFAIHSSPLISSIDLRNGNNEHMNSFNSQLTPSLTCISVDDVAYAHTNWTFRDVANVFKLSCDPDEVINIPNANFKAALVANAAINDVAPFDELTVGEAEAFFGVVDVSGLSITDLTGIEYFSNITQLKVYNNSLTSLNVTNNTNLNALWAWSNILTDIDVTNNIGLQSLILNDNTIGSIDLSSNTLVKNLQLNNCGLNAGVDLSNQTQLVGLSIDGNDLTSIDLSNNTGITDLRVNFNKLTSLDLAAHSAIKFLRVQGNQLTSLDLSTLLELTTLYADINSLESLDLSSNTAVHTLSLKHNELTSLNVANGNNSNFLGFESRFNTNLTCITVDNPAYSRNNWTGNVDDPAYFKFSCDPNAFVNIPDANFKTALLANNGINTTDDGEITYGEAEAYATPTLDVHSLNIDDLTGVEAFINLTGLYCSENNLTSLDVSNNTKLTYLHSGYNDISEIDISNNSLLSDFRCQGNEIATLDFTNNTELVTLIVSDNNLNTIDVSNLVKLRFQFSCGGNLLNSLDVTNNPLLERLFIQDNEITSLDLSNNPVLEHIYLINNDLSELDIRSGGNQLVTNFNTLGNPGLNCVAVDNPSYSATNWTNVNVWTEFKIGCDPDEIIDIPDANFKAFLIADGTIDTTNDDEITVGEAEAYAGVIDISNLNISDLTGIEYFENITVLKASNNLLTTVDLRNNTQLVTLWIRDNLLSSIDLSSCTNLDQLFLNGNQLSSIDLSNNTMIDELALQGNNLTSVDVSALTILTELNINDNQLTSIDVSNNTDLRKLYVDHNNITNLDIATNTKLVLIYVHNNGLNSLNVSTNIALQDISAHGNSFASIDVSSNTALTKLTVSGNPIAALDLSSNTLLRELSISNCSISTLDLSANTSLERLFALNNSLSELNVANGNNNSMTAFNTTGNPNLTCITVDDIAYSQGDWTDIDIAANFSTNCNNVANDMLSFSFAEQLSPATIDATAHTVIVEVALATVLSNLVPTFTISSGATVDILSGIAQDFSRAFTYIITAENPTDVQTWTVIVLEENVAPTALVLDNNTIDENNTVEAMVGALSSTDGNMSDAHSYSLVAGAGDTDNTSFAILGSNLVAAESFDYEIKSSYSVRIQTDDGRGGVFANEFAIAVNDIMGLVQTVTFDALDAVTIDAVSFELSAVASSGLVVSYSSSDETVATVLGDIVTVVGAGSTEITAVQAGDADYLEAENIVQILTVNKLNQSIEFGELASVSISDDILTLDATASSGLDVSYSSSDESVATVIGSSVTIVGAGTSFITASQTGDLTHHAALDVVQELTVDKGSQTITVETIENKETTAPSFNVMATSDVGLEVSISVSGPASISGTTITVDGSEGTVIVTASQAGNANYEAAEEVSTSFEVIAPSQVSQTITFDAIDNQFIEAGALTLSATASSGLVVSYEIVSGPATVSDDVLAFLGFGEVVVRASQAGNDQFLAAEPITQSFEIITVTGNMALSQSEISTYPNPVTNTLYISAEGVEVHQVQLLDLRGKSIITKIGVAELDLSGLQTGQYILRISVGKETITQKVIKR
jgi:Leucine-rich repeat (LRR) protein